MADHFVDITEMVGIGSGAQRAIEGWAVSAFGSPLGVVLSPGVRASTLDFGLPLPPFPPLESIRPKVR